MTVKTVKNICKSIAWVQAIVAPCLMIIGHMTGNKIMRNFGAGWCAAVVLDTGRLSHMTIDMISKENGWDDDMEL